MGTYHKVIKITQFFERDKKALTAMGNVGYIKKEQLKQCGVVEARLKNYIHDGYVKAGDKRLGYKLTDKGKELLREKYGIRTTYNPQSEKHDLGIAGKYFSLGQEQRDTWKNESELREDFHQRMHELREQGEEKLAEQYEKMLENHTLSMCDGSYLSDGVEIYFEIITDNYGNADLMAKEAVVQIMQVRYETQRV